MRRCSGRSPASRIASANGPPDLTTLPRMPPPASVESCRLISLPRVLDPRGSLTFIEGDTHIPFTVRRSYWIYDVPGGERRGGHGYRTLSEFVIAVSGSFDVVVDDGTSQRIVSL